MDKLFSMDASRNLIGCLLNNPKILLSGKYNITRECFKPSLFLYRLCAVIENLAKDGAEDIDGMMVDQFVKPYEEIVELFDDNNMLEFVTTIKELVNAENIELYYNTVKKYEALRDYRDEGSNIDEIFDVNGSETEEVAKLERLSLDDIVNYFDGKNTKVKKKYVKIGASIDYKPSAEKVKKMVRGFKETPLQGACLQSPYLTTLFNGASRGNLHLRGGNSGSGKTTLTVGDVCCLCAKEYYDTEKQEWIINNNRQGGGLHIHSESDTEKEVMTIYLAYISGVPRNKITKGLLDDEEDERVMKACEILEDSEIFFVYDPKFTLPSIRESIKEYSSQYDIFAVFFDYLAPNGCLSSQMIAEYKNFIPDHQVLLMASEALKLYAEEFDVYICTGMQLNDTIKTIEFADESTLSASKAVKNKLDGGCIVTYPKKKELKEVQSLLEKRGFGEKLKPNRVAHMFKGRFNSTGYDRVKIFQCADLGTGRVIDLFCTDEHNNFINIDKTMVR